MPRQQPVIEHLLLHTAIHLQAARTAGSAAGTVTFIAQQADGRDVQHRLLSRNLNLRCSLMPRQQLSGQLPGRRLHCTAHAAAPSPGHVPCPPTFSPRSMNSTTASAPVCLLRISWVGPWGPSVCCFTCSMHGHTHSVGKCVCTCGTQHTQGQPRHMQQQRVQHFKASSILGHITMAATLKQLARGWKAWPFRLAVNTLPS